MVDGLLSTAELRAAAGLGFGEFTYLVRKFPDRFPTPRFIAGRRVWSRADVEKVRELRAEVRRYVHGGNAKSRQVRVRA